MNTSIDCTLGQIKTTKQAVSELVPADTMAYTQREWKCESEIKLLFLTFSSFFSTIQVMLAESLTMPMTHYRYQALDHQGKTINGRLEASSESEARRLIRQKGHLPLQLSQQKRPLLTTTTSHSFTRFSNKALTVMVRQLATLADAKLSADQILEGVYQQTANKHLKDALALVREKVLEGYTMASAMRSVPQIFSPLFCASIEAGESAGNLSQVLLQLADHLENRHEIKNKITQAILYPTIMLTISLILTNFLLIYVVPKMVALFQSQHKTLPLVTRVVITISHTLRYYAIPIVVMVSTGLLCLWYVLKKGGALRNKLDRVALRLPIIASLLRVTNTSRYLATLSMLCRAGVPIISSMIAASQVVNSHPLQQSVHRATDDVNQGTSLSRALAKTACFNPMTIQLIANGEISGNLTDMLQRSVDLQDSEITTTIDTALTISEPLMIVMMGGIVLVIMMAILLPIFDLQQISM